MVVGNNVLNSQISTRFIIDLIPFSSLVFTKESLRNICRKFLKGCKIIIFFVKINSYIGILEFNRKLLPLKRKFCEEFRKYVHSGFVKTCYEHVISLEKIL